MSDDASDWQPAPPRPRLELGEVHVWRVNVDEFADDASRLAPLLNAEEASRATRFVRESDRRRFAVTRGLLRVILSRYLDRSPPEIDFSYGPRGKPSLAGAAVGLTFNVSHSRALALFAVSTSRELGVDVEHINPNLDVLIIVDRFFSAYEVAALHARPPRLQREAFFQGWVRKEAYIKARGEGLSIPLHSFDVTVYPDPPVLLRAGDDPAEPNRWFFHELAPGPGYAGMLVTEGAVEEVECYSVDRGDWLWL